MTIDIYNLSQYSENQLIDFLKTQDDLYENDDSEVSDGVYDTVRRFTQLSYSGNIYFTGVGSSVRGGKIALPHNMSGLTQVYTGEVHRYVPPDDQLYVISDKLDGTSAQVLYDASGALQIAFSRGNGYEAADITRHIRKVSNIPKQLKKAPGVTLPVRLEMIVKKHNWEKFVKPTCFQSNGDMYKNARAFTAGTMNASEREEHFYDYIEGVAYTIMDSSISKLEQLQYLEELGFKVTKYTTHPGSWINDKNLSDTINLVKTNSEYELDGVVVNINNNDTPHPLPAFKYKITDDSNIAIAVVTDVICSVSKDSYLKPTIHIQPIELNQVTVSKCTGFNIKFIMDNNIQPGSKIRITRSGDVIPYILGVVDAGNILGEQYQTWLTNKLITQYGAWEWSKNSVDAILVNKNSKSATINHLTDVFTKLKIAHLKDGNTEKLYDAGYTTTVSILNMDYTELYSVLGEIGVKVYDSMEDRLSGIYWPEFVGSLNIMGRGIGRKKLTKLYDALNGNINMMYDVNIVANIPEFDTTTASLISSNLDNAISTLKQITSDLLVLKLYDANVGPKGTKFIGQYVVFTGVRSPEVEQMIVEQGGIISSGVSKTTTIVCAKDPSSNSGKAKKARDINQTRLNTNEPLISILTVKELEKLLL